MKYRIWEMVLNEYTNSPENRLIEEIEAKSHDSAHDLARQMYPNRGPFRVDDHTGGGNTAIEYTA